MNELSEFVKNVLSALDWEEEMLRPRTKKATVVPLEEPKALILDLEDYRLKILRTKAN